MDQFGRIANRITESRQHLTDTLRVSREKLTETTKYAKLLLGCYRTGDANDPEVYTAGVIAVLSDYSSEIVRAVCDPRTGIPSEIKWLPTLAEIKKACEELRIPMRLAAERDARIRAQFAERDIEDESCLRRPTIEEMKEKYGETWGLNPRPEATASDPEAARRARERSERDIEAEYSAHGEEPVRAGDILLSRELVHKIRGVG